MLLRAEYKDCKKCGQSLPEYEFTYQAKTKDGLSPWCRDCHAACAREWSRNNRARANANKAAYLAKKPRARQWRVDYQAQYMEANRDKAATVTREWNKQNPDRVKMQSHVKRARKVAATTVPFTKAQLEQRLAYWGGKCWMCGAAADAIDHVKPLSKGGPHMLANLRPACGPCNNRKRAKWPFSPHQNVERAA